MGARRASVFKWALSLPRRRFPCGIALERAERIDMSSANFTAKSHFQTSPFKMSPLIRTHSTTTRDRNLQFRGAVSTGFFEFSPVDSFPLSPGFFLCNLIMKSPQNVEKIARLPGGEKVQNPVTSLAVTQRKTKGQQLKGKIVS